MGKNHYKVLGVMSGTSLDGIDLALLEFKYQETWKFKILEAETVPLGDGWKKELSNAVHLEDHQLEELNLRYTHYLSEVILSFLQKNPVRDLDAVCSHGHTVKHEPHNQYTLQIGNLPHLADLLGHKVVCDFRVQDVELGGQGAPLVPIGDELLFSSYKYCLNLGGFANISTRREGQRIAYDICAVNTVLNFYAEKLGMEFDRDGLIAASGGIEADLLQKLDNLQFYKAPPPKSLGIEWVKAEVFPLLREYEDNIPLVMGTYTRHIAIEIAKSLDDQPTSEVLATGGGSFNKHLISEIKSATQTKIVIPGDDIVNFKEALIFGFLGVLRLRGEINVLSAVTGAKRDHSSGVIYELKKPGN